MIGDEVTASEERAARLGLQWLYDYAISVGWPIAREPITIYLDNDLGLAQILAEEDGTVEPGEIDVHLGFIRDTGGFAGDDNNYTRASNPGEPVNHDKTVTTIAHETSHIMFQRDLAGIQHDRPRRLERAALVDRRHGKADRKHRHVQPRHSPARGDAVTL